VQHKKTIGQDFDPHCLQPLIAHRYPRPVSHHRDTSVSNHLYSQRCEADAAPAKATSGSVSSAIAVSSNCQRLTTLYSPEERRRRDATPWTLVQGILAPLQFLVFLVSVFFVVRYLFSGEGLAIATASIVAKTILLYAIMITGSIWEREVFGVYLFAPAFFWEDVFSFLVLALHTAYLGALLFGFGDARQQMFLALSAYAAYVVNATQFLLKLRAARRDEKSTAALGATMSGRPT
jgi:3-vinyl bacteriochlorophyllide hydratase